MSDEREDLEQAIQEVCASVDRLKAAIADHSDIIVSSDVGFLTEASHALQRFTERARQQAHHNYWRDELANC